MWLLFEFYLSTDIDNIKTRHQQKASKGRQKMDQETGEEMENKSS